MAILVALDIKAILSDGKARQISFVFSWVSCFSWLGLANFTEDQEIRRVLLFRKESPGLLISCDARARFRSRCGDPAYPFAYCCGLASNFVLQLGAQK